MKYLRKNVFYIYIEKSNFSNANLSDLFIVYY